MDEQFNLCLKNIRVSTRYSFYFLFFLVLFLTCTSVLIWIYMAKWFCRNVLIHTLNNSIFRSSVFCMLEHETETLGPLVIRCHCQHIFGAHFYQVNISHCHQDIPMKIWHSREPHLFQLHIVSSCFFVLFFNWNAAYNSN